MKALYKNFYGLILVAILATIETHIEAYKIALSRTSVPQFQAGISVLVFENQDKFIDMLKALSVAQKVYTIAGDAVTFGATVAGKVSDKAAGTVAVAAGDLPGVKKAVSIYGEQQINAYADLINSVITLTKYTFVPEDIAKRFTIKDGIHKGLAPGRAATGEYSGNSNQLYIVILYDNKNPATNKLEPSIIWQDYISPTGDYDFEIINQVNPDFGPFLVQPTEEKIINIARAYYGKRDVISNINTLNPQDTFDRYARKWRDVTIVLRDEMKNKSVWVGSGKGWMNSLFGDPESGGRKKTLLVTMGNKTEFYDEDATVNFYINNMPTAAQYGIIENGGWVKFKDPQDTLKKLQDRIKTHAKFKEQMSNLAPKFGSDPAPGEDKWLRVLVRNGSEQEEKNYNANATVDLWYNDPLLAAWYGVRFDALDVTEQLKRVTLQPDRSYYHPLAHRWMNNDMLGYDPLRGQEKTLLTSFTTRAPGKPDRNVANWRFKEDAEFAYY